MFQKKVILIILAFAFFSSYSLAQDLESCNTTLEMIDCTWKAYQPSDKEINNLHSTFVSSAGNENMSAIKKAQIAWVRFKEKFCKVYDDNSLGTSAPIEKNICLTKITEDRSTEIKRIMQRNVDKCSRCDDFFRAVAVLSASGYKKSEVLSKINTSVFKIAGNEWKNYVHATCDFSEKYINDKRDMCEARLNFIYLRNYEQVTDDE
jgi:uncharacterized protein YecT (DUF1311 family)